MIIEKFFIKFDDDSHKYIQLYRHIKQMIEEGVLYHAEKLPTIRSLSAYLDINSSTVVNAYALLEKEKYIYKKEKSGCYVYSQDQQSSQGLNAVRFDLANPRAGMFNIYNFKKAVELAISNEGESLFDYQEGLGYEPLRKTICNYIAKQHIYSSPERIQIISGAQQGINIISKSLLSYGDVVFMEEPSYPGAIDVFREHGIKVVGVPLLDDGIDIGVLKQKLEKMKPVLFYTMPNFQNPTGITYSKKKKLEMIALAHRYNFLIVEDDYISDFRFMASDHRTIRSYDNCQTTIYIKSFSKILMPGLRIGFLEMPSHIRNLMSRTKYSMDISTSSFIQLSLYYYMKYFDWNEHLRTIGHLYQARFKKVKQILDADFRDILSLRNAAGGINFFVSLPKEYSSIDLKRYLEKYHMKIVEGNLFYPSVKSENNFRISISYLDDVEIEKDFYELKRHLKHFLSEDRNKMKYQMPNIT